MGGLKRKKVGSRKIKKNLRIHILGSLRRMEEKIFEQKVTNCSKSLETFGQSLVRGRETHAQQDSARSGDHSHNWTSGGSGDHSHNEHN
jgi:hypothetical protein